MTLVASLPADLCYWVRLPASNRPWSRERVLSGIEPWIPSDVDLLEIAWAIGSDRQVLVVAVEPARLTAAVSALPEAWAAVPDSIPGHVTVPGVAAADLNLLTGKRTPIQQRRLEYATIAGFIGMSALALALIGVGAWRRNASLALASESLAAEGGRQLAAILPATLSGNDPDPLLRLDQAQRMSSALLQAAGGSSGGSSALFTTILSAWPASIPIQVSHVAMDADRCTISGSAATVEAAQHLATTLSAAMSGHAGWRMLPLQASTSGHVVTFTCTLVREVS